MTYRITTPNPDFVGVVGGVSFVSGKAEVAAIPDLVRSYMEGAGYVIEKSEPEVAAAEAEPETAPKKAVAKAAAKSEETA